MLESVLLSYKQSAEIIDWKSINRNDLFYEYIKHENDDLKNNYYAGIVCTYWNYVSKLYNQCNKHVPIEQCYDVLIDTINYVLDKRVWENKTSSLHNVYTAADQAFHVAYKRMRYVLLSNLTAKKRKSNFNTLSIEGAHEDYNDAAEGIYGMSAEDEDIDNVTLINLISSRDPLERILLDSVCFNTWSTLKQTITKVKKVSESDYYYYNQMYNITKEDYNICIAKIEKLNNKELLQILKRELYLIKGVI